MTLRKTLPLALLFGALQALSGCAGLVSAAVPNPPFPAPIKCPPLASYTALEQGVLAQELPKDGPETQAQIEDYLKLRAACRSPAPPK